MQKALLILTAIASLTIANAADQLPLVIKSPSDIVYTVTTARFSPHYESAVAKEGTTYLLVKMTVKNIQSKQQLLHHLFGPNFTAKHGEFSYDVDGGVGWQTADGYSGDMTLTPLIPRTMIVAFTVPLEIASGEWTVTTPTGESFTVAAN
jgi:hypothetical protein